jgi:multidrug efflux pump subunit AcrB
MGTPVEVTRERLRELSDKALSIPEIVNVQVQVAVQLRLGAAGAEGATTSSHLGQLIIELKAADEREVSGERSSEEVLAELRNFAMELPGVNSVVWESLSGGPGGRDMEIRVGGPNFDDVIAVAEELKARLNSYAGVVDLDDNMDRGQREMQLRVREAARPAGITVGALGDHVRSAMYGKEARRITRDREDVRIMVRYSEDFRESVYNVESMWIPLPAAAALGTERPWAPLRELASFEETQEFGSLNRSQQARSVKVFADVQEGGDTSGIVAQLQREFDEEIRPKYPAVSIIFQGNVEENARSFDSLKIAMPVALMLIYLMIAGLFRSYVQPVVVMLVIPFALVGAILGHWLLGFPLTFISAIGMLALMGIVVNDSIVLVDYVNRRIREGSDPFTANLEGSRTRLRAIFLTSETTIAGLLPMLFETSFQAKFLIPMAITICFGLLFSTVLTLVVLPSINMIFFDVLAWFGIRPMNEEDESVDALAAGDRSLVSL